MVSLVDLDELKEIIDSAHGDPHHILGLHEVEIDHKPKLVARAFVPQASAITLVDAKDPERRYPMRKIHQDGFFETLIEDRCKWFMYKLELEGYNTSWTNYDPYSFQPVISELDRYLFGQGTHYEIYDKLGAHFLTHQGIEGVLFAVWAPNARRVSVIGSFNSWDGRRHMMRSLGSSGIWELFIPGLNTFDQYKYEIKTKFGSLVQKSDPYGSFSELRPSTSSLLYDINGFKWSDSGWMKRREKEDPLKGPVNIYELHLGSWKRGAGNSFLTYSAIADELIPYIKNMGYTHIELMPIEEHPLDASWGYQVVGYYAPSSRYGNPSEFMSFVDRFHQSGIGVILDWVPAHFPKDDHGLGRFDGTALYEHEDPRKGEHPDWGTYIFNYGRNEVKNFLIGNAIFWLEKYHIDGLRVDAVASMLYLDYGKSDGQWVPNQYGGNHNLEAVEFMRHMNSVILGRNPNVLMIAEESTAWAGVSRPVEQHGLGFTVKWNMGWMNDFLSYIEKESVYRKYHHNQLTFSMVYAYTENFILVLSHDEVVHGKGSIVGKMPGDLWQKLANLRVAYGFMYGHPGKKLLFMGSEFAQFDEWSEEKSLDWFLLQYEHHQQIQSYTSDLNHLYLKEEALWHDDFTPGGFEWINCSDYEKSLVAFLRKGSTEKSFVIVVCNFTPVPYNEHRIGVPLPGKYKEIINSDDLKYGGSGVINTGTISSDEMPWDGRQHSIGLRVPPLGVAMLKLAE
ncbi:MAG: 1,4-alpha-glucan branching protein GlgB [Clostridiales bacterium]|jgi:1,4-alpha-glucan branching enzyme|nr:1,4-alpha-glucan branching protein GlgB [Clostridiales bacterium]